MSRCTVLSVACQALVSTSLALAVASAHADSGATTVEFGALLSGAGAPTTANFAQLTVQDVGNDAVFTLTANNLALFSGSAPFLGAIALDLTGNASPTGSISGVSGGVTSVDLASGGGPGGGWDLRFDLGGGARDRLLNGETLTWTWVGGAGLWDSGGIAAHVQGISYGGTTSAWYRGAEDGGGTVVPTPTVVPEPGVAALFGVGVAAVAARRRRVTSQER